MSKQKTAPKQNIPEKKHWFHDINQKLSEWVDTVQHYELLDIATFIDQVKVVATKVEGISEEKLKQFSDNLQQDLIEFYQQTNSETKHSAYLAVLSEVWWQTLADMSDKSQIEWAELTDDLKNSGEYKTGDVIGFGLLACQKCQEKMHITHHTLIDDCIHCGHDQFNRLLLEP